MKETETYINEPWLKWAIELQGLAQSGLTYTQSNYEKERYERIREISAEMLSYKSEIPVETVKGLFCNEKGYQTPKVDTRGVVFQNGKILLVQENDGRWALPGGWCDVTESVKSNTEKEVREEAGLDVEAKGIIAVQERNKHNRPFYAYGIFKIFVVCDLIGGEFKENIETLSSGYFSLDNLPDLAEDKCSKEQVEMCFEAIKEEKWITRFD